MRVACLPSPALLPRRAGSVSAEKSLSASSARPARLARWPLAAGVADDILNSPEFRLPHEAEEEDLASLAAAAAPAPTPAPPSAPPLVAKGNCYGCGAPLQLVQPGGAGYVAPARYQPVALHRQTDAGLLMCARCSGLAHGKLLNAVEGQGSGGAGVDAPGALVAPERFREHLTALRGRKTLVVLLVDALDFSGSFLPRLRDAIGANPVLLVVTKADLLPPDFNQTALSDWIQAEVGHRRLTLVGLHLVSSLSGDGMGAAVAAMASLRSGRDVAVIGAANVGKSSFIRAALTAMRAGGDLAAPSRRLPMASPLPGTTLGVIPLRAFRGRGMLYDTPGVVLHHRVCGFLDGAEVAALQPRGALRPREARTPDGELQGSSFFWEALLRIDVIEAPPGARLLFFGPGAARVATIALDAAEAGQTPWVEATDADDAAPEDAAPARPRRRGALGAEAVALRGGLRVARTVELTAGSRLAPVVDLHLSGFSGWAVLVAGGGPKGAGLPRCSLRVWAPRGAEVFARPPMPIFPVGAW